MTFHPVANIFPLIEGDALAELAADIKANGLREPILLDLDDGSILDGRNRFRACALAGVEPHFETWDGKGSRLGLVVSLNLHRRHLDAGQRGMVAARVVPLFAEEARQRQLKGVRPDLPANLPEGGDTRDKAAAAIGGVSGKTVDNARKVIEHGSPAVVAACDAGKLPVSIAAEIVDRPHDEQDALLKQGRKKVRREAENHTRARKKANQAQRAATANAIELPTGKYHCLVIDPPWEMEKIERDERPKQVGFEYRTMTEAELRALPVPRLAFANCHLYLWTTHKHLPLALALAKEWGFNYECLMTWVKNVGFAPYSWMRSTEHVLFCRRGNLPLQKLGMRLDFSAARREHSRKPGVFYELVREVSPGPRLDMFSREAHEGFEAWGNEKDKFERSGS